MKVEITRATTGWHQPGKGWRKGAVFATVDGINVALLEGKGWQCRCERPACWHIDTVRDLIAPETIARIEAGRPTK
ncbi:hypothetical protein N5P18_15655 [Janibacter terrae]|uniref:SWIM-type domain-containing protein n=1 Tax=Janibacter terrae TaxID=103817 RepID=A0ABZ2FF03_9MICO